MKDVYILSTKFGRVTLNSQEEIEDTLRDIIKTNYLLMELGQVLRIKLEKLVDNEYVIAPVCLDTAVRKLDSEDWYGYTLTDFTRGVTTLERTSYE